MRTPPPRLPGPSPEPPGTSLLPAFPDRPVPMTSEGHQPLGPGHQPPGPGNVVRLALPAAGPPYDDQDPPRLPPSGGVAPVAPVGFPSPASQPGSATSARLARLAGRADGVGPDGLPGPDGDGGPGSGGRAGSDGRAGSGLADDPRSGGWTSLLAQALVEALAGSRAPRQIAPWTTEQARRRIRQIGPLLPAGQRPMVRRVLTSAPGRDVVEMTVIVGIGPLTRAIAVRLERAPANPARPDRGRPWLCTVIEAA
jgi:hypothetical protein